MSLTVLQAAPCSKACAHCPTRKLQQASCDSHTRCAGYGSSAKCPPLIVLAVIELALQSLGPLPAFGAFRSVAA